MPINREPTVLVDLETGARYQCKDDKNIVPDFFKGILPSMFSLRNIKDWTPTEVRLFFSLVGRMDSANVVDSRVGELAEDLDIVQPNVSKALEGLIRKGLAVRCDWHGKTFSIMMNPRYLCRVGADRAKVLLRIFDELALDPRNGGPGEPDHTWEPPGVKDTFDGAIALKEARKTAKYGDDVVKRSKERRKRKDAIPY